MYCSKFFCRCTFTTSCSVCFPGTFTHNTFAGCGYSDYCLLTTPPPAVPAQPTVYGTYGGAGQPVQKNAAFSATRHPDALSAVVQVATLLISLHFVLFLTTTAITLCSVLFLANNCQATCCSAAKNGATCRGTTHGGDAYSRSSHWTWYLNYF